MHSFIKRVAEEHNLSRDDVLRLWRKSKKYIKKRKFTLRGVNAPRGLQELMARTQIEAKKLRESLNQAVAAAPEAAPVTARSSRKKDESSVATIEE